MSTNTNTKMAEALQDGLSVCNSVSMAAGRRVVIDGCVLYAQTEEWCQWAKKEVRPRLQTALNAHDAEQAAQAVPAGFKWVPVEPTLEMLTAAGREDDKAFVDGMPHGATAADVWAAMLSAAPRPGAVAVWQPIETAPKDGSLFLCWVEAVQYGENDEGQQYQIDVSQVDFCQWQSHDDAPDGGWFEPCCGHISDHQRVTHWMPLPAAPQEPTHG